MSEKKLTLAILAVLTLAVFVGVFVFVPRIPQSISYHQFSDTRTMVGIANFANVISNIPFVLVAILGFVSLWRQWRYKNLSAKAALVFLVLFVAVLMTGIGSAYYHWLPDNNSLVWDRLPMSIVFMSLLSLTIMARVDANLGFELLIPLIIWGIFSVLYWHWTELSGRGDLRLYGITQFYTLFLIMAILYFFPKPYPPVKIYIGMFIFYGLAKLCEHFDMAVYRLGGLVSGHTLKHIFAAISIYGVVMMLNQIKT